MGARSPTETTTEEDGMTEPDPDVPEAPGGAPQGATLDGARPDATHAGEPADAPPPPRDEARARRRPWGRVLLALLLLLIAGAVLGKDPMLRYLVRREAARFGVEIEFTSASLGLHRVDLHDATLRFIGVSGTSVTFETLSAQMEGLHAQAVEAAGVVITLRGSAADRLVEIGAWAAGHADFFEVPGSGSDVRITWSASAAEAPWLDLPGGTLRSSGNGAVFRCPAASLFGVPAGALAAAYVAEPARLSIGLGKDTVDGAPIKIEIHPEEKPPSLDLTIAPLKVADLGAPLGLRLPAPGATVEGSAHLVVGEGKKGKEPIDGSLAMTLTGWIPPHPRELDGIVYGKTTTFTSKLHLDEERRKVTLSETRATAGSFKLEGGGSIERQDDHATARLALEGRLACADLARSAALGDVGGVLGALLGEVAHVAVRGTVAIKVSVEADSRDVAAAKIKQEVGVGCGIKIPTLF
ncbi:MAG: hypothetical protein U0359_13415 [Byssovorax sp.]